MLSAVKPQLTMLYSQVWWSMNNIHTTLCKLIVVEALCVTSPTDELTRLQVHFFWDFLQLYLNTSKDLPESCGRGIHRSNSYLFDWFKIENRAHIIYLKFFKLINGSSMYKYYLQWSVIGKFWLSWLLGFSRKVLNRKWKWYFCRFSPLSTKWGVIETFQSVISLQIIRRNLSMVF